MDDKSGGGVLVDEKSMCKKKKVFSHLGKTINHFLNGMSGGENMKGDTVEEEFRAVKRY